MKRKFLAVMALICMLSIPSVSYAATGTGSHEVAQPKAIGGANIAQPYYVNTMTTSANLRISGNTAYANASVTAKKVCHVSVIMRLQRKSGSSWSTVSSWVESSDSGSKSMTKPFTLSKRGTYRVYAIFNVAGEETTNTSPSKTY